MGQSLGNSADGLGYLIASPTKAVCDLMVLSRQLPRLSRPAMLEWLLEDLRLDPDLLSKLRLASIEQCMEAGFKRQQLETLRADNPFLACSWSWQLKKVEVG